MAGRFGIRAVLVHDVRKSELLFFVSRTVRFEDKVSDTLSENGFEIVELSRDSAIDALVKKRRLSIEEFGLVEPHVRQLALDSSTGALVAAGLIEDPDKNVPWRLVPPKAKPDTKGKYDERKFELFRQVSDGETDWSVLVLHGHSLDKMENLGPIVNAFVSETCGGDNYVLKYQTRKEDHVDPVVRSAFVCGS